MLYLFKLSQFGETEFNSPHFTELNIQTGSNPDAILKQLQN